MWAQVGTLYRRSVSAFISSSQVVQRIRDAATVDDICCSSVCSSGWDRFCRQGGTDSVVRVGQILSSRWDNPCRQGGTDFVVRVGQILSPGWDRPCRQGGTYSVVRVGQTVSSEWDRPCRQGGTNPVVSMTQFKSYCLSVVPLRLPLLILHCRLLVPSTRHCTSPSRSLPCLLLDPIYAWNCNNVSRSAPCLLYPICMTVQQPLVKSARTHASFVQKYPRRVTIVSARVVTSS